MKRSQLDEAFPTVCRYVGVFLAVVIVFAVVLGRGGVNIASLGVLALGMILYKTVKEAASPDE